MMWRINRTPAPGAISRSAKAWLIIPGDHKVVARGIVAGIVADQLRALAPEYPQADGQVLKDYRQALE